MQEVLDLQAQQPGRVQRARQGQHQEQAEAEDARRPAAGQVLLLELCFFTGISEARRPYGLDRRAQLGSPEIHSHRQFPLNCAEVNE